MKGWLKLICIAIALFSSFLMFIAANSGSLLEPNNENIPANPAEYIILGAIIIASTLGAIFFSKNK